MLAVATRIARKEGLPDPIPITRIFQGVAAADEDDWQECVHPSPRCAYWQRLRLGDDLDLVGPLATAGLREHGVLWPPTTHVDAPMLALLRGGTLLDGEGGDDVASASTSIASPRWLVCFGNRARSVGGGSGRAGRARMRLRKRHVRKQYDGSWSLPWLRPAGRAALLDALSDYAAREPLSFSSSISAVPRYRMIELGMRNRKVLADAEGVTIESPFLHSDVVEALALEGGRFGPGSRTQALRRLVGDLLPAAVLDA